MSDTWIISKAKKLDMNISNVFEGVDNDHTRGFRISDIADYMLDPRQISINKKLMGYEVHYIRKKGLSRFLREKLPGLFKTKLIEAETYVEKNRVNISLKDNDLTGHFAAIEAQLRPHEDIVKKLNKLDFKNVVEMGGYCQEPDENCSWVGLPGTTKDKVNFLYANLFKDISILSQSSYHGHGLFEMRGYNFRAFVPDSENKMVTFRQKDQQKAFVLHPSGKIKYMVEDPTLVNFLQLFEHAIESNPGLEASLEKCIDGDATPFNLFFNAETPVEYKKALPKVYQDMVQDKSLEVDKVSQLVSHLGNSQVSVVFNYVPEGQEKVETTISVMHDMKALDPIKDELPRVYNGVRDKAKFIGNGRFYLLDTFGVQQ